MNNPHGKTFEPRLLAESTAKFHINAPTTQIDIPEWLFNVDDLEYIDCTPDSGVHLSAGSTHSPDGKRMSINVEDIGGALIVEHYHEVITEKLHCRVQSSSDFLFGRENTKGHVIWELIAAPRDGDVHEFTNNVWVHTTEEFEQYLDAQGLDYEQVREKFQKAIEAHNSEETPYFAAAIERKALKARDPL